METACHLHRYFHLLQKQNGCSFKDDNTCSLLNGASASLMIEAVFVLNDINKRFIKLTRYYLYGNIIMLIKNQRAQGSVTNTNEVLLFLTDV